jgi:hypothetical protein
VALSQDPPKSRWEDSHRGGQAQQSGRGRQVVGEGRFPIEAVVRSGVHQVIKLLVLVSVPLRLCEFNVLLCMVMPCFSVFIIRKKYGFWTCVAWAFSCSPSGGVFWNCFKTPLYFFSFFWTACKMLWTEWTWLLKGVKKGGKGKNLRCTKRNLQMERNNWSGGIHNEKKLQPVT